MAPVTKQDRSARRTRRLGAAAVAAVVFLAGMAARGALGDRDNARAQEAGAPPVPAAVSGPGPITDSDGAPAGFAHDREGAHAAAVAFTATLSQRLLYMEPAAAEAAVRAVAADASADTLVNDALAALDAARETLAAGSGPMWWAVRPLAVKVEAFSPQRARVSVWLVRILSRQGVVVPQSSWVTETVELVWETR
ncbi:MAG: hypothetical protein ACRDWI_19820 [Jiangellaceae bacterium]